MQVDFIQQVNCLQQVLWIWNPLLPQGHLLPSLLYLDDRRPCQACSQACAWSSVLSQPSQQSNSSKHSWRFTSLLKYIFTHPNKCGLLDIVWALLYDIQMQMFLFIPATLLGLSPCGQDNVMVNVIRQPSEQSLA